MTNGVSNNTPSVAPVPHPSGSGPARTEEAAPGSLPGTESSTQRSAIYRSEEMAQLIQELRPLTLTRPLSRANRPDTPRPGAAGSFGGMTVAMEGESQEAMLRSVATHTLALLDQWEHMMREMPLHLETHERHSVLNENVLRSFQAGTQKERDEFETKFRDKTRKKLEGELMLTHTVEEIEALVSAAVEKAKGPRNRKIVASGTTEELRQDYEQLRKAIGKHLEDARETGKAPDENYLKKEYKRLANLRLMYRTGLGYDTAKVLPAADEIGPGNTLHGPARKLEVDAWKSASRISANRLRNQWHTVRQEKAAAQRSGMDLDEREGARKIPGSLSVERMHRINTGLFARARTLDELGISDIIQQFYPPETGPDSSFDAAAPLLPRGDAHELKEVNDVNWLMSELAGSPALFHVIGIPGDQDGSIDRCFVFRNAGTPELPTWQMLPHTGTPLDSQSTSLGIARNVDPPLPHPAHDAEDTLRSTLLDADQKKENPLPNRFVQGDPRNVEIMRMESNRTGVKAQNPGSDVLFNVLDAHRQSVRDAGGTVAPVIVMSPQTPFQQDRSELLAHLGYELPSGMMEPTNLKYILGNLGCQVSVEDLDAEKLYQLRNGHFDVSDKGAILQVTLQDGSISGFAWGQGAPDRAYVFLMTDNGPFSRMGLQSRQTLVATKSQFWNNIVGELPIASVSKMDIAPASEGRVAGILMKELPEKSQSKLLDMASKEQLYNALISFRGFGHVFKKVYPHAVAATYELEKNPAADTQPSLGDALDRSFESFMVECRLSMENGVPIGYRFCFLSPGAEPDKNAIIGYSGYAGAEHFHGTPSRLLESLREMSNGNVDVSVLSTGPLDLGEFNPDRVIDIDKLPRSAYNALEGLSYAGNPVFQDSDSEQEDFLTFIHDECGVPPKEITGEILGDYIKKIVNPKFPDQPTEVSIRLSQQLPLNFGTDFEGGLIRVPTKDGMFNVTFHEGDNGEIYFKNTIGEYCPVSQLEERARLEKWHADGPVEIIKFKGPLVGMSARDDMDADEAASVLSEEGASGSSPAPADPEDVDLGADTEWEH